MDFVNLLLFAEQTNSAQPIISPNGGGYLLNFVLSVLASLVAAILLIIIGAMLSRRAKWVFTALFSRLLDIDLEYVFPNKDEAQADIERKLQKASFIRLCTGRGNELQRGAFLGILNKKPRGKLTEFKTLLPKVNPTHGYPDWVEQHESELAAFDPAFGKGVLKTQIQTTIEFLGNYVASGDIELKLFESPHIGRFLLTDRVVYFTP